MNPGEETASPRYKHKVLNSHSNLVYLLGSLFILLVNGMGEVLGQASNVCGTVKTTGGDVIILKENEALSSQEFDKVHIMKLQSATFTPVEERQCIIKLCGFTTFSQPMNHPDGCIGSRSDLMDCQVMKKSTVASIRYNERFNTSSISCGCFKLGARQLPCQSKCLDRKELLDAGTSSSSKWKGNECAILFHEHDCRDCYFDTMKLETGKEFRSDNSHHINTIIVRDKCVVSHYVPGLRRICHFKEWSGIFAYTNQQSEDTDFTPNSAFQIDQEILNCTCEEPDVTTGSPVPGEGADDGGKVPIQMAFGIVTAGFIVALGATVGLLIYRQRWMYRRSSIDTEPENKKSPVIESNETKLTGAEENIEMKMFPDAIVETPILANGISQVASGHQIIPTTLILEQLKSYVELLFESARREEELNVPSVNKVGITATNCDANIAADQFHLICEPQFVIRRHEFEVHEKELGSGQFGIVYTGTLKRGGDGLSKNVAIKRLKWLSSQEKVMSSFLREVKIFQFVAINHENIVRFYGACYHNGEFYILTQLCENGSLRTYLKTGGNYLKIRETISRQREEREVMQKTYKELPPPLTLQTAELCQLLHWSEQIANGMDYLHRMNIIHFDLAARNVLLSTDLTAKIADLGLSRKCSDGRDYAESVLEGLFPPNSFAPECIAENVEDAMRMTVFVDIWAFGCTIWEIFSLGDNPYHKMTLFKIANFLKEGGRLAQPELAPNFVYEKLLECWDEVPQRRPSFQDLRTFFEEKRNNAFNSLHF